MFHRASAKQKQGNAIPTYIFIINFFQLLRSNEATFNKSRDYETRALQNKLRITFNYLQIYMCHYQQLSCVWYASLSWQKTGNKFIRLVSRCIQVNSIFD